MLKLPPWDTPAWRLSPELRPFYAAVNRVRDLEATPGASLEDIAQPAMPLPALRCDWCGSSMLLSSSKRSEQLCTTSGKRNAMRSPAILS